MMLAQRGRSTHSARGLIPGVLLSFAMFSLSSIACRAALLRAEIDGPITPVTAAFMRRAIDEAARRGDDLLLIRLKTPGGLGVSMQEIVEMILNSTVPVAVYVAPSGARAASAGFFILLAADVAAMAPGTNTGAAHPVFPFGGDNTILLEKVTNDALANLRSIAKKRRRNSDLAEKGVRESVSFTETEAIEGRLIDLVAADEADLLKQIDQMSSPPERLRRPLSGQAIVTLQMSFREKLLSTLSNPNLAIILGIFGLLGLYLEVTQPGMILPGVAGAISLLLSLLGLSVLPINYVAVLLVLLAFGLLVAEVKVQGFGVLGVAGSVALVLGLLFLVEAPTPDLGVRLSVAMGAALPFALIFVLLLRLVVKSHSASVQTGLVALVGHTGAAMGPVSGDGKVFVDGEIWNAYSSRTIDSGKKVRIVRVDGMKLEVEELGNQNS